MAMMIEDKEIEILANEVAILAHESKMEAIRQSLVERRTRLRGKHNESAAPSETLKEYLERYIWPNVPASELGRTISREQEDQILGYGPGGV